MRPLKVKAKIRKRLLFMMTILLFATAVPVYVLASSF